jgi:S1-C subfamily serine protease
MDLPLELIHATVQLEQPLADGTRTVGTGFLIASPTEDGRPRTVLVTAQHVFARMPSPEARIGYRTPNADGSWAYAPKTLRIRADDGAELWIAHPTRDIAVMAIRAPVEFARAALPLAYLADDATFSAYQVGPGDEMMALGFPRGLSANAAGFPILRSGRVASFPLGPPDRYPTFLLDFSVFPGNSGGPVFITRQQNQGALSPVSDAAPGQGFIAGLLTQWVDLNRERLDIGIVTHARYIREAIAQLSAPAADTEIAEAAPAVEGGAASAEAAAETP